ncbi:hypothetical protein GOE00_27175 [Sinorhizobium medicae]|nr:hypothetical protein [Sinorhizobium medicae]
MARGSRAGSDEGGESEGEADERAPHEPQGQGPRWRALFAMGLRRYCLGSGELGSPRAEELDLIFGEFPVSITSRSVQPSPSEIMVSAIIAMIF